jgi:hypothetical protein
VEKDDDKIMIREIWSSPIVFRRRSWGFDDPHLSQWKVLNECLNTRAK